MVRGPPKKPMNEGPFVHWHRKITYLYYITGGKDMVTITFSGDAEEVLLEMQRLVNMKKVEETPKKEAPKEEPKQDDTGDAPMTEEQTAELRTLCMNYCKKVPDGKERIKQLLKGKGCARVTDLKQKDIPEFKALVLV